MASHSCTEEHCWALFETEIVEGWSVRTLTKAKAAVAQFTLKNEGHRFSSAPIVSGS